MKKMILILLICLSASPVMAKDMREAFVIQEQRREQMAEQARRELEQARSEAGERTRQIRQDREVLTAAVNKLKGENSRLTDENARLNQAVQDMQTREKTLAGELEQSRGQNRELSRFIHSTAKDLESLIIQSPRRGLNPDRHEFLAPMIQGERFPSMADIHAMADLFFEQIAASGQVRLEQATIVDRQGRDQTARVLMLGNFTGIYVLEDPDTGKQEIGFLLYSDNSGRLFALSRLPDAGTVRRIQRYLAGGRPDVPMDITRGAALRQYVHQLDLAEQIPKGGPIVWPILAILCLALIILLERLMFFGRRRLKTEAFMAQVRDLVTGENWDGCEKLFKARKNRLIPKVLLTALPFRGHTRQDMENALQEAILGEIPAIERFVSTLGMLAAIAPLLGLLGTVTGMINTFHVITHYGAGDPRMMSGGISEALVTTMLGLTVAIPIMLCHTLLSRRVETQISVMEEKAVAFVNMVFKAKNECRP